MNAEHRTPRRVLYLDWWKPAADALARHGGETTFVVPAVNARVPAKQGFTGEVVVVPDQTRADDVIAGLARASIDLRSFDLICTEHEQSLVAAAVLAELHGRPGIPVATAVALRDKFVQKARVRAAGIPAAACRTFDDLDGLRAAGTFPFVVKPLDGAGARLTYAVHDQEELDRAVGEITASGQAGPWLVEELMTGAELHLDGVVRDGSLVFLGVSRYLQNVIDIREGGLVGSLAVDPAHEPRLYERSRELAERSLAGLGHRDGVFHMEAFEQPGRLVFSECAGRIGGGMVWETTNVKFGVDLYDEWARAVLGVPTGLVAGPPASPEHYGWVQLNARPGRVTAIPSPDELEARPGVVAAQVNLRPGDAVPDATVTSSHRAGRVVMTADSETALATRMRAFVDWFGDQVEAVS